MSKPQSAKDKAQELVDKYLNASFNCKSCEMPFCDVKCTRLQKSEAKECALIALDEILEALELNTWQNQKQMEYYKEVKSELEKL